MNLTLLFLIGLVLMTQAAQGADPAIQKPEEKYLCVTEAAGGVSYNTTSKEWEGVTFKGGNKYIISPPSHDPRKPPVTGAFQITELGEDLPEGRCKEGFNNLGFLFCDMMVGEFKFNRSTGRFLMSYMYGYYSVHSGQINTPSEKGNTPHVQIGKCSPF